MAFQFNLGCIQLCQPLFIYYIRYILSDVIANWKSLASPNQCECFAPVRSVHIILVNFHSNWVWNDLCVVCDWFVIGLRLVWVWVSLAFCEHFVSISVVQNVDMHKWIWWLRTSVLLYKWLQAKCSQWHARAAAGFNCKLFWNNVFKQNILQQRSLVAPYHICLLAWIQYLVFG